MEETSFARPTLLLKPGRLTLDDIIAFEKDCPRVALDPAALPAIEASAAEVDRVVRSGEVVYGITTGFGLLAKTTIPVDSVTELQRRLVLSHAVGVGEALSERVVRLILLLKINALSRGFSGVRPVVLDALLALLNADLLPEIPAQGSVGASGDLAPLAHMSAVLLGEGYCRRGDERIAAKSVLAEIGTEPLALAAKEGLALLNGTQVSCALALVGLIDSRRLAATALVAGALSVDAALGSDTPFDDRIHQLRGHPGQIKAAAILRDLLRGSALRESHLECDRVQDPYCLRCQPQVMGAVLDLFENAKDTLEREANAVSDNPLVFADSGEVLSGGNFHAEPIAFAADAIAMGIAETGSLSERRTALLTDPNMSGLPAFLVAEPGLNSGFMILHVTAAALVAENKQRATPASIDSIPTSANQEDHVSMATHGARRLLEMLANARRILAIEILAATQGIELRELDSSPALIKVIAEVRQRSAFLAEDRSLAGDIDSIAQAIDLGVFSGLSEALEQS